MAFSEKVQTTRSELSTTDQVLSPSEEVVDLSSTASQGHVARASAATLFLLQVKEMLGDGTGIGTLMPTWALRQAQGV